MRKKDKAYNYDIVAKLPGKESKKYKLVPEISTAQPLFPSYCENRQIELLEELVKTLTDELLAPEPMTNEASDKLNALMQKEGRLRSELASLKDDGQLDSLDIAQPLFPSYCEKCVFKINYDKFHDARMAFEHHTKDIEIDKIKKEHYFNFMEWVFKMEGFYAGLSDRYLSILNDEAKFNSLDELYQYWKDQILKGE